MSAGVAGGDALGYNIKNAETLMENIVDAYENLGLYTEEAWEPVKTTLRDNWIGADEQDFEKKLIERICTLYVNSYQLVNNCVTTIESLVSNWFEFQKSNTLDGGVSEYGGSYKLSVPKITPNDKILKFNARSFSDNEMRGLASQSSAATIKSSVETFVNDIKNKTNTLFTEIDVTTSFYGGQVSGIQSYIEAVKTAVSEVTVAIKDMYDAIDQLATSNYDASMTNINEQFTTANSTLETQTSELGTSRWV